MTTSPPSIDVSSTSQQGPSTATNDDLSERERFFSSQEYKGPRRLKIADEEVQEWLEAHKDDPQRNVRGPISILPPNPTAADFEELKQRRVKRARDFIAHQAIHAFKLATVQEAERIDEKEQSSNT